MKRIAGEHEENKPPAVLIVGEKLPLLYSLQALLRINGYHTDLMMTDEVNAQELQRGRYSLILLDSQGSSGAAVRLLERLKQDHFDSGIVILTSDSSLVSIKDLLQLGAYDFVRKPYRPEDLLVSVSRALERLSYKQQLKRTEQALSESERMHRFIVNNSPDFIYMLDSRGCFTFVNDMVERLLGYRRHELMGQHFSTIIHPHNAEVANHFFSEQRSADRAPRSTEMRLRVNPESPGPDAGAEVPVELNAMGLYSADENGRRVFSGTLGSARDITERKRSEEKINFQAHHDLVTRLPNRLLFADRMEQALAHAARNQSKIAVMFMDLDNFKDINDNFGHVTGDRVLQQLSARIQGCVRGEDTVSRFGGDEFSLLLVDIAAVEDAVAVAEKILAAVRLPMVVDGHPFRLSVSMGIALYPDAGTTVDGLLHSADMAMYHVKAAGRDGYHLSDPSSGSVPESAGIDPELRLALEQGQFQVFFQPKVNPVSHQIVGMEALLRWRHPRRGLLFPKDFIAAAEKSRRIVEMGRWAMAQVCDEMVRWRHQGLPRIKVSLNLSTVELEEPDYADHFAALLKKHELDPALFELQITEQVMLDGALQAVDTLRTLSRMGTTVVIDDFGCGHSSLSYLLNYPVNTLMIDRSFVRDICSETARLPIVDGIAMMAKSLKLSLTAKGVENVAQLERLRDLGCSEVQGYYYGEPRPAQATFELLQNSVFIDPEQSTTVH